MEDILSQMDRVGDQIEAVVHQAVQKELIVSSVPSGHKLLETLMLIGSAKDREKTSSGGKVWSEAHEGSQGNRFVILGEKMAEAAADKSGKGLYLTAQDNRTYPLVLVPGPTGRRFYISGDHPAPDGLYTLTLGPAPEGVDKELKVDRSPAVTMLKNRNITLRFNRTGAFSELIWNGKQMLASGSLMPYIRYGAWKYEC